MKKIIPILIISCFLTSAAPLKKNVFILHEKEIPQIEYATRKLTEALLKRGIVI